MSLNILNQVENVKVDNIDHILGKGYVSLLLIATLVQENLCLEHSLNIDYH